LDKLGNRTSDSGSENVIGSSRSSAVPQQTRTITNSTRPSGRGRDVRGR